MELKLAKLPDRTPVKITISVKPDLHAMLSCYAEFYRQSYGEEESLAELIPFMLQAFMDSDRGFAKALKEMEGGGGQPPQSARAKTATNSESSS
jgi:hypothetical protein